MWFSSFHSWLTGARKSILRGRPGSGPGRRPARVRPRLEVLESRDTPALTVTTLADSGAGSLRAAIDAANAAQDADTIVFDPSIRGGTVVLTSFTNPASTPDVPQPAGPSALVVRSPITIQGAGETITRGSPFPFFRHFRLFQVTAAGSLTLQNLTLTNGLAAGGSGAAGGGGGAGLGGAIYNQGILAIDGCTLTGNEAQGGPGGEQLTPLVAGGGGGFGGGGGADARGGFDPAGGGFGGGTGGTSPTSSGGGGAGLGGAIFNQGGTVMLINSTVTGNAAKGGDASSSSFVGEAFGGGVFNLNGDLSLVNCTISASTVAAGSGGLTDLGPNGWAVYSLSLNAGTATASQSATLTMANCILATPVTGAEALFNAQFDGTATINATGPNILFPGLANGGVLSGTPFTFRDPKLGPLADNGGPTQTMRPQTGSVAIDHGSNAAVTAAGLTTDQRGAGFNRVSNGTADIGAVEVQAVAIAPASLPAGQVGIAYRQTLTPDRTPAAFTVTSGSLPPGLTLSSSGVLGGTPTAAGTFRFTATATVGADFGSRAYTLTIDPVPPPPPQPSHSPPAQLVAVAFRQKGVSRVRVRDAASGALRGVLTPFKGFGGRLPLQLVDVNGDGSLDLVVRAVIHGKRKKKVYDAVTLAPLPPGLV
jgi:hypothetical protein